MDNREQGKKNDWNATLTLWQASAPPGCSSEDSIRAQDTFPMPGKTKPRFRTLENSGEQLPDFRLGEEIGSGGMGVVYAANQTVFDREVAVKMVKPGAASSAADALMAEAVVTGRLEHPNVVPVYDLGVDAEGNLFYAMKEVQGASWAAVIAEKPLDENLDILLRVADTVSFAHSRGILHRDLKPHNVMIGDFGEVMVLDWGASCALDDLNHGAGTLCGTPAYMPPEMACGDFSRLGVGGDVYLLGAILYQILTGHPPRREKDPVLCIVMASENHIEPAEDGELLRIALKAMAAVPVERFSNVRNFQHAIREYRSHSESLRVQENAKSNLIRARAEKSYDLFSRAVFGFREALQLWTENPDAEKMRFEAELDYARCAFGNSDFELAQSLLDSADPVHRELLDMVSKAIRERDAHKRRSKRFLSIAQALGIILLLIFLLAFILIRKEQKKTAERHRESLAHLIAAHFGQQNYEAAVSAFWQLNDQYGMDALDENALLDIRVAATMNPGRGMIQSGVKEPLGIEPSVEEDCIWIVGKNELKKVRLTPQAGYEPETAVQIHDFEFGKRKTPGEVFKSVPLPNALSGSEAMHEAPDGTLWIGSGSSLYRRQGEDWIPVVDVSQLDMRPLPEAYNIDRAAVEKWMTDEGRGQPITGIVLNRSQTHAAVALGPQTICWIDLINKKCLGWHACGHGTRFEKLLQGGSDDGVELELSADESQLSYRPGVQGRSMAFLFDLPSMFRRLYVYNRDFPLGALSFAHAERFFGIAGNGYLYSPGAAFEKQFEPGKFCLGPDSGNGVRWGRERCDIRQIPVVDISVSGFAPNGKSYCVYGETGVLVVGPGTDTDGFIVERRIIDREPIDCFVSNRRTVSLLSSSGTVHLYEMDAYSVADLKVENPVRQISRGGTPDSVYALIDEGAYSTVYSLKASDNAEVDETAIMNVDCNSFCIDPSGRFLALSLKREKKVVDLRSKEILYQFYIDHGDPSHVCKFDESGALFTFGGDWAAGLRIARTDTWEELWSDTGHFLHVVVDLVEGETRVLCVGTGRKIYSFSQSPKSGELVENWTINTGSSPLSIVPFTDPVDGRRKCWCKLWFQSSILIDAEDGAIIGSHSYWKRSGLGHPEFISNDPRVIFPQNNGCLQIALKSDLYPVFDPRILDFKVEKAVLNTDSSRLYLLGEGRLRCMKLPSF